MGKPGKKAGNRLGPSTDPNRTAVHIVGRTDLRSQRKVRVLKMYKSKITRDSQTGRILTGSVLSASERVPQSVARIAPDRRWFGNTRVIGSHALQAARGEMHERQSDPYSIVLRHSKLPLSLLQKEQTGKMKNATKFEKTSTATQNAAAAGSSLQSKTPMRFVDTFGTKSRRKRVSLSSVSIEQFRDEAQTRMTSYNESSVHAIGTNDENMNHVSAHLFGNVEHGQNTSSLRVFEKGQSSRCWGETHKVIDSSDVILYVLDARDPMGTRSPFLESYLRREKVHKHLVLILNKCDLVPSWAVARWLQILSKEYPTLALHSSPTHPFGKGNLINLLRQFSRLHNVTHGSKAINNATGNKASRSHKTNRSRNPISVGILGYPNVGKSSLINTLRRKKVCKVAPIPGETKVWQYVMLTRSIYLIDCPGVVYDKESNSEVQSVLKGVVRVERLAGVCKTSMIDTVLKIVKHTDLRSRYKLDSFCEGKWGSNADFFLTCVANVRGKLLPGGLPDTEAAARIVLYDWQRGQLPWFSAPPFSSNQKCREAQDVPEAQCLKWIENYASFNIVDQHLVNALNEKDEIFGS
mmetsp:Transcript_18368/g.25414  ORF Transcript_18368/g.25414 Transcript_18368/m.25414 type:complete len:580 (-) Transcript_18368:196-1935(-)